jgi:hypothetical protein
MAKAPVTTTIFNMMAPSVVMLNQSREVIYVPVDIVKTSTVAVRQMPEVLVMDPQLGRPERTKMKKPATPQTETKCPACGGTGSNGHAASSAESKNLSYAVQEMRR